MAHPVDVSVLGTISWLSSADWSRDRPKTVEVSTQSLVRYTGASPCRHLYVSKDSLYVTRCGHLSQCNELCIGAVTEARVQGEQLL